MMNMDLKKEISIQALQIVNYSTLDDAISAYFMIMET